MPPTITLDTLPPHIQYKIFRYVLHVPYYCNPDTGILSDYQKSQFYNIVSRYEVLTGVWCEYVQRALWRDIKIRFDEIPELRKMLETSPHLCGYIQNLTLFDPCMTPGMRFLAIQQHPERFSDLGPSKFPTSTFSDVWTSISSLITDKLAHVHGSIFRSLIIHGQLPIIPVAEEVEQDERNVLTRELGYDCGIAMAVDLPDRELCKSLKFPAVEMFAFKVGRDVCSGDRYRRVKCTWNPQSLVDMVGPMRGQLRSLELEVDERCIMERTVRRDIYVALCTLLNNLTRPLYPHLTSFTLNCTTFVPSNQADTNNYPYTTLDGGKDLQCRALRILSKQLVHFNLIGCRISSALFIPDSGDPDEPLDWPYLKTYQVTLGLVSSSGEWLWGFDPHNAAFWPLPSTAPISVNFHSAIDSCSLPMGEQQIYTDRYIPIRRLIDLIFRVASLAMAPHTCTPSLESWGILSSDLYLGFVLHSDWGDGYTGPELRWSEAYAHADGVINSWVDRFTDQQGVKLSLRKVRSRNCFGEEFMEDIDKQSEDSVVFTVG